MLGLVIATLLSTSLQDQLEGAEIGDATQYVAFQTGGKYRAERKDGKGRTVATGTWAIDGERLEVKVEACKGPACATLGKPWTANAAVVGERAMTLRSEPVTAPLATGSYYCRSQGCEKRLGVELVGHKRRVDVMRALLDFLIDRNRARDVTVVWTGSEVTPEAERSRIQWCAREEKQAKEGAALVAADLASLGWFGKVTPEKGAADCLYDVRVIVGDEVRISGD